MQDSVPINRMGVNAMDQLAQYIEHHNALAQLFGQKTFELDTLTMNDCLELLGAIEGDLSPENLTCDGELPRDEVSRKAAYLEAAQRQLHIIKGTL